MTGMEDVPAGVRKMLLADVRAEIARLAPEDVRCELDQTGVRWRGDFNAAAEMVQRRLDQKCKEWLAGVAALALV